MLQIQSMYLLNDYIYSTVVTEQIRNGQWVGPGFLNLGTGDIWGQISLWCRGGGVTPRIVAQLTASPASIR